MNIEKQMKINEQKGTYHLITIILFSILMLGGSVLGFLLFLRPSVSEFEKRDLETFPEFSVTSLLSGSYTDQISLWYADTYPFRDDLLENEQIIKTVYGLQRDAAEHVAEGDDIPDFPVPSKDSPDPGQESVTPGGTDSAEDKTPDGSETAETADPSKDPEESTPSGTESQSETAAEPTPETSTEVVDGQELTNMNPQEAGSVNVKDLVGYCVYGFNLKAANIYGENVARTQTLLPDVNVYNILVPNNSAVMLDEETRKEWKLSDEHKVISYFSNYILSLNDKVKCIPILDKLLEHRDEYLYFKTDHHWTQLGAYYTLEKFLEEKGWDLHPLSDYKMITMENFLGSYYSSSGFTQLMDNPDTIYAYEPITTNDFEFYDVMQARWRQGKIVRDLSELKPTQKYQAFIYGDNPIEYIRNPKLGTGRSVMVVKESFGNTFIPFLADYYDKVVVVDYRGYKESIIDLAQTEEIDDIIFINNLEAIGDVNTMNVLGAICYRSEDMPSKQQ